MLNGLRGKKGSAMNCSYFQHVRIVALGTVVGNIAGIFTDPTKKKLLSRKKSLESDKYRFKV